MLIAPDCFTGTLTAPQAASAIATGWSRRAPDDVLDSCPLSDGGPGFLDVLAPATTDSTRISLAVVGPVGATVRAQVLLSTAADGVPVAYVESAQACGLHLVPPAERNPGTTTTAGVAALLRAAREAGARRIVVGLGGSGTNDGGAGLLAALGAGPVEVLARGGAGLAGMSAGALSGLAGVRREWSDVEIVVATDVDVPLLGFHGASASFAEQKGATPEQAQALERCLGDLVAAATASGVQERVHTWPGAGSAGGLGYALFLLGGQRVSGVDAVLDAVGAHERIARADLVVTGEGKFDWQSLRGKVVAGVAAAGLAAGTPVIVIAGQVEVGRREAQAMGVEASYALARTPQEVATSMADPTGVLAAWAERVARTWSVRR